MIPSLLQIPSAVSDSKLHSVLPNNGKGDFTFDRSTGATRINKDGLIEEVGYFSSELVQNGDFSELGSELVTNGDFADNSWWQLSSSNVNISNGKGNFTAGTTEYFYKTNTLTVGKTYKIVFEITDYTTGYITAFGGSFGAAAVGVGTYIRYYTAVDTTFGLVGNTFVGSIDNVSVKQVDPNDRWTKRNGSTISEDVATVVALGNIEAGSNNWTLYQTVFEQNKTYKVTFKARQKSGSGTFQAGRDYYFFIDEVITSTFTEYSFIIDSGSLNFTGHLTFGGRTSGNEFEVDNVSVVEVQGDRPRLSYDITNGVVEDQPHLLLEPSSTNLVVNSNSSFVTNNTSISYNNIISPDGTQNGFKAQSTATGRAEVRAGTITFTDATFSVFVKYGNSQYLQFLTTNQSAHFFNFDVQNGVFGTNGSNTSNLKATEFGNGWYRVSGTFTSGSGVGDFRVYFSNSNSAAYGAGTSTVGDFFYAYGWQVETTAYATSYIPTAGTTITRAAETCNNSKPSVNSTEGVLYCEIQALANDLTYRAIYINDNDATRYIGLRFSNNSNQLQAICYDGANLGFIATTLSDITNTHKIALQYQSSGISLYVNGSLIGSDATFTGIAADQLDEVLFDSNSGTQGFYGKCKGLAVYNEALSESQLMQLTGVTASSIYSNFVTRTASFTVEALNEVKKVIDNL